MPTATKTKPIVAKNLAAPAEVRAWAIRQGLDVGVRGRISDEIRDAFNKRHRKVYPGAHPETRLNVTLAA